MSSINLSEKSIEELEALLSVLKNDEALVAEIAARKAVGQLTIGGSPVILDTIVSKIDKFENVLKWVEPSKEEKKAISKELGILAKNAKEELEKVSDKIKNSEISELPKLLKEHQELEGGRLNVSKVISNLDNIGLLAVLSSAFSESTRKDTPTLDGLKNGVVSNRITHNAKRTAGYYIKIDGNTAFLYKDSEFTALERELPISGKSVKSRISAVRTQLGLSANHSDILV